MKKLVISSLLVISSQYTAGMETLFSYDSHPEEWCLAQNIYYEARGSSFADQIAVADVVLNRKEDSRYPNTICGVVRDSKKDDEGNIIKNKCQFSWYCDGKPDWPRNETAWKRSQALAYQMLNNNAYVGITEGSTHYHATYVVPSWADSLVMTGQIGEHIYYKWVK